MIKIENAEVVGLEHAIRGMRNPLNSWDKSDSFQCDGIGCSFEDCPQYIVPIEWRSEGGCSTEGEYVIGKRDLELMKRLVKAGTDHRKFMRMIVVYMDVTAPLYWWKEFDTYKVGTVKNSCSTMHKITEKEFTFTDFSCENLYTTCKEQLGRVINDLNELRNRYNNPEMYGLKNEEKKRLWYNIIQLLPSSYNQKRTVQLNYEVLLNMYHARRNHKLDEWHTFCDWVETLPYFKELVIDNV